MRNRYASPVRSAGKARRTDLFGARARHRAASPVRDDISEDRMWRTCRTPHRPAGATVEWEATRCAATTMPVLEPRSDIPESSFL